MPPSHPEELVFVPQKGGFPPASYGGFFERRFVVVHDQKVINTHFMRGKIHTARKPGAWETKP